MCLNIMINFHQKYQQMVRFLIYLMIGSYLLYASLPVQKLHPHGDIISKLYKPTFYGGHLSHITSYGGAATIWIFHLSMAEILLFNLVFHNGVTPVSVSTLKPQASPILSVHI